MKEIVFENERTFPAEDASVPDVTGFVEDMLGEHDCPMKTVIQITVAIEEIFVNIAHYGYPDGKGDAKFAIAFDEDTNTVAFRFVDSGVPFNPLDREDPDVTASAEERPIGGLGIFIMKKTMDEVDYRYENGQNILTMLKKIA